MRGQVRGILLFLLMCLRATYGAEPITVAVFDFDSKEESVREYGGKVAALVTAKLTENSDIYTVERSELEKVLGEQELGLSGTVSPESAARVGHLTGANVIVTGRVFKVDKEMHTVVKIISTETSRVFGQTAKISGGGSITDLAEALAVKIGSTVTEKRESLLASAEGSKEKIRKFLKEYKLKERRTISIAIPEVHYGSQANDPAAQTELENILQNAGFEIVDEKSNARPDIIVSGEAFSALGGRIHQLVSCKARIEIKARDQKDGKILVSDRQTSVAVDIAEQTAAKSALENAAREVAIRLLTKLNAQ